MLAKGKGGKKTTLTPQDVVFPTAHSVVEEK
jgi:hypothetical protein